MRKLPGDLLEPGCNTWSIRWDSNAVGTVLPPLNFLPGLLFQGPSRILGFTRANGGKGQYMTRKLKLNSIDQFVKSSPALHLEEYDSCEVPSGCGGVVLRWTNKDSPIALDLVIRQNGTLQGWVNGHAMCNRNYIPRGKSVLALHIIDPSTGFGLLQVAAKDRDMNLAFVSEADGTWRASAVEPKDDSWMKLDYDDTAWTPLVSQSLPPATDKDRWAVNTLQETGAAELGTGQKNGDIWIRKIFQHGEPENRINAIRGRLECVALGKVSSWIEAMHSQATWGFAGNAMVPSEKGTLGLTSCCETAYLRSGRHVLGFRVEYGSGTPSLVASLVVDDKLVLAATQPNATWKSTDKEPSPDWLKPEFDDTEWKEMVQGSFQGKEHTEGMLEHSMSKAATPPAQIIAPRKTPFRFFGGGTVWIRHVFDVKDKRT